LYYKETLQELQASNFHPALDAETVRDDAVALPALSSEEWEQLVKVGTLEVPQLVFARGSARLTSRSQNILDDLAEKLNTWPQYYVLIRGNASTQGDLETNRQLAANRAKEAEQYLIRRGIDQNRARAVATEPSGSTSVSFLLGQPPY
jgi:outer membrane protein OmpA-like peptidoglycan-associated protein